MSSGAMERRLSPEEQEKRGLVVRQWRDRGHSIGIIASAFNISKSKVYGFLKEYPSLGVE